MAEQQDTQKRVLLPQYYPATSQFKLNGIPSGNTNALAKCVVTLEQYPHWFLGYRVENQYDLDLTVVNSTERANLQTGRVDAAQQLRCVIGTFQLHDWTKQSMVVGQDGTHWAPTPIRLGLRGGVAVIIEGRRLQPYPSFTVGAQVYNIIPELAVTVITASLRVGRPGDTFDIDVLPYPVNP